jgi:hypothetical protein
MRVKPLTSLNLILSLSKDELVEGWSQFSTLFRHPAREGASPARSEAARIQNVPKFVDVKLTGNHSKYNQRLILNATDTT